MLFDEHIVANETVITTSCISSLNRRKQLPQAIIRIQDSNEILIMDSLPFDSDNDDLNNSYLTSLNVTQSCHNACEPSSLYEEHSFIMNMCPLSSSVGSCADDIFHFPGDEVNIISEVESSEEKKNRLDSERKEKNRLKKRAQRSNPTYKEKEKEREKKRMRKRRMDPSFRDNERRAEALRKRLTRKANKKIKDLSTFTNDVSFNLEEEICSSSVVTLLS